MHVLRGVKTNGEAMVKDPPEYLYPPADYSRPMTEEEEAFSSKEELFQYFARREFAWVKWCERKDYDTWVQKTESGLVQRKAQNAKVLSTKQMAKERRQWKKKEGELDSARLKAQARLNEMRIAHSRQVREMEAAYLNLKWKLDKTTTKTTEKTRKKRATCEESADQAFLECDVDPDMDGPVLGADE